MSGERSWKSRRCYGRKDKSFGGRDRRRREFLSIRVGSRRFSFGSNSICYRIQLWVDVLIVEVVGSLAMIGEMVGVE